MNRWSGFHAPTYRSLAVFLRAYGRRLKEAPDFIEHTRAFNLAVLDTAHGNGTWTTGTSGLRLAAGEVTR
jgi:hypothetical protein